MNPKPPIGKKGSTDILVCAAFRSPQTYGTDKNVCATFKQPELLK